MEKEKITRFLLAGALVVGIGGLAAGLYVQSDWRAPTLRLVKDYEAEYGQPVNMYHLIEEANDRSDFTLSMTGNGKLNEEEKTITFPTIGQYPVEITATDSHGNKTTETVTVHVVDLVPPVITAEDFTVYVGSEADYTGQVTAIDDIDGDLTQAIQINDSRVDFERPGRYEVVYSVKDRSGNSASYTGSIVVEQEPASSISLSREEVYLAGNEYEQLEVTIEPSDWDGDVKWTSSDPSVATVSDGLVSWTGVGSCVITATADEASAECTFICNGVAASDLWLSQHTIRLKEGESETLTTKVWPSNWSGSVTWESSDSSVATVDGGVVTWTGSGSCTITATTSDGQSDSCTVTCEAKTIVDIWNDIFGPSSGYGNDDDEFSGNHQGHSGFHGEDEDED